MTKRTKLAKINYINSLKKIKLYIKRSLAYHDIPELRSVKNTITPIEVSSLIMRNIFTPMKVFPLIVRPTIVSIKVFLIIFKGTFSPL